MSANRRKPICGRRAGILSSWIPTYGDQREPHSSGVFWRGGAGGGSFYKYASNEKLDSYLTGEISENDWFDAKEAGLCLFAGGHNATEEFGILALMKLLEKKFKVDCEFIKSYNPI